MSFRARPRALARCICLLIVALLLAPAAMAGGTDDPGGQPPPSGGESTAAQPSDAGWMLLVWMLLGFVPLQLLRA